MHATREHCKIPISTHNNTNRRYIVPNGIFALQCQNIHVCCWLLSHTRSVLSFEIAFCQIIEALNLCSMLKRSSLLVAKSGRQTIALAQRKIHQNSTNSASNIKSMLETKTIPIRCIILAFLLFLLCFVSIEEVIVALEGFHFVSLSILIIVSIVENENREMPTTPVDFWESAFNFLRYTNEKLLTVQLLYPLWTR